MTDSQFTELPVLQLISTGAILVAAGAIIVVCTRTIRLTSSLHERVNWMEKVLRELEGR